ncbi:hypothetical protein [Nocardioides sp. 503]|uniref:hypothetical protein n=1 Tax=Nocardioides sp. 503 TaxID=2508326 RepID=UPI0010701A30|nr:hypothetical protein [Nocardioides sp. 503]
MNRTLVTALAVAAIIGTTVGGVTAVQVAGDDDNPSGAAGSPTSSGSSPASPSKSSTPPSATPQASESPAASPDDVLWATQRVLHDGDREVRINLVDAPAELHRIQDGWLVTTRSSPQEPAFEAFTVRADGSVTHLADTFLNGDVNADGTRYVAMRQDAKGYGVWDVTTGEEVALLDERPAPGSFPSGGAAFEDDGATVLTRWGSRDGGDLILSVRVSSGESSVAGDGLVGAWTASPDGSYLAGTAADARDAETGNSQCLDVAPTDAPDRRLTDCGHAFVGTPSFSPSGDLVLAAAAPVEGFGPGIFRAISVETGVPVGEITSPDASLEARLVDDRRAVVLAAGNLTGDGTVVYLCELDGACKEAGRSSDAAESAVLGEVR